MSKSNKSTNKPTEKPASKPIEKSIDKPEVTGKLDKVSEVTYKQQVKQYQNDNKKLLGRIKKLQEDLAYLEDQNKQLRKSNLDLIHALRGR